MFALEDINKEKERYVSYSSNSIPDIKEVRYDLSGDTFGQVKFEEITSGNIILHLNKNISKYNIKYQTSILWHEFTHIYDLINCGYDIDMKKYYIKTISEIKAVQLELRYLLGLKKYEKVLYDTKTKIYLMNYHKTFEDIMDYYNACCKIAFEKLAKDKTTNHFNTAFNNFMYLCGCTSVSYHELEYVNKLLDNYPNEYSIQLKAFIELLYKKDELNICKAYSVFKDYVEMTSRLGIN